MLPSGGMHMADMDKMATEESPMAVDPLGIFRCLRLLNYYIAGQNYSQDFL